MSFLAGLASALFLLGPVFLFIAIGAWTLGRRPDHWRTAAIAAAAGGAVWATFLAVATTDPDAAYVVLLAAMPATAAVFGAATEQTPSVGIGAALVAVPAVLAWSTAPKGDHDGLWILVFWVLAFTGGLAAGTAEASRSIVAAIRRRRRRAGAGSDR